MASKVTKTTEKSLTPIAVLIDELKSEDIKRRVNSVKNISTIAVALGADRSKSELVPFLNELLDDEDEVLLALAESIPTLLEHIGGSSYYYILLEPLEKLTQVDEVAVREKAVQSLKQVLTASDVKKNDEALMAMIRRFVSGDSQASKAAAASLVPAVYSQCSVTFQNELLKIYSALCSDDVPMVRKSASVSLKDFVRLLPNANETELLNIFRTLLKDEQDFVRLCLVDSIIAFETVYANNTAKLTIVVCPFIKSIVEDQSWRIRYTVSDKISELGQNLGKDLNKKHLLPHFIKLLSDPETEIRTSASSKLAGYANLLDADDIVTKLIPAIKPIANDNEQSVRAALASSLLQLCPLIGKKYTNDHILSIFLLLLRDEFSDVRLELFKHLDEITKVIDIDSLSQSLYPALNELAADKNWRTRASCIELLPFFARKMGEDFLNDKFAKILLDWLSDRVFGVRDAAVDCSKILADTLGGPWVERVLLPKISILQSSPNYLHRQTLVFTLIKLIEFLSQDALAKGIMPILMALYKDPVPNVKMNVAKAVRVAGNALKDKTVEKENVKKMLAHLAEDPDPDVSYQAKKV